VSTQCAAMPKFHHADFHQNFPVGSRRHKSWKSQTQMVTNHETMKFQWKSQAQITKIVVQQSQWQVCDKPVCVALMDTNHENPRHKSWKSATWFVSRTFMICVRNKVHDRLCHGLCHKFSIMESGHKPTFRQKWCNSSMSLFREWLLQFVLY